jgi:hypothetical protein
VLHMGDSVEAAVHLAVQVGPATRMLAGADAATRSAALQAMHAALAAHQQPDGAVRLGSAGWLVEATNHGN